MGMFARARCFQRSLGWWSMAADAKQPLGLFVPTGFETFRFTACELDASGRVTLRYALDDEVDFVEALELPIGAGGGGGGAGAVHLGALGGGRELLQDGAAAAGQLRDGRPAAGDGGAAGGALLGRPGRAGVRERPV